MHARVNRDASDGRKMMHGLNLDAWQLISSKCLEKEILSDCKSMLAILVHVAVYAGVNVQAYLHTVPHTTILLNTWRGRCT